MIIKIGITLYIIPLFCFYTFLVLGQDYSDTIYFMWDKSASGSFWSWLMVYALAREQKKYVAPVLVFALIRVVWEVISKVTGVTATNDWRVASLFIFLCIVSGYLVFNEDSYISKFLNKHLKRIGL